MSANVTINPYITSQGNAGLFNVSSTGVRQGTAYPDPSTRFRLRGCTLSSTETLPMWGGVGVYMDVPGGTGNPSYTLGPVCGRAVSLTDASKPLLGFSVFDQDYSMITSPQSPVPLIGSYGMVNVYPLGSLARIAVACDPALSTLRQGPINANVSWDFTNQMLVPYLGTLTISSGTYNNTTGLVTLTMSAPVTFDAGDSITIASLTGTGAFASLNGTFTALSATGTAVTYNAGASLGASTITGGNLTVGGAASQALAVKILDIMTSGSETVVYSASTGFATWNYNGACAIIQI